MVSSSGGQWRPDPTGRHELRYYDGTAPTDHVCDGGVVGVDAEMAPVDSEAVDAGGSAPPPQSFGSGQSPPVGPTPQPNPYGAYGPPPGVGPIYPALPATPEPRRRRVGLPVAIVIAALEGVAIVGLVIALLASNTNTAAHPIGSTVSASGSFLPTSGSVVYSSKFASNENWYTGNVNSNTTVTMANGQYVVQGWSYIHHLLLTPYTVAHFGMSVEAEATGFSTSQISMGVGCQSSSGINPPLVYQLSVYPDGDWFLEEGRLGGSVETLTSGQAAPIGSPATFQLTCVMTHASSNGETTQLVAYINGIQVAAIGDQVADVSFDGYVPILVVGSYGPRVHVAYTGVSVRSITAHAVTAP